jgi:class 3 adenylate cyclase
MQSSAPSQCAECGFQNDDRARFCASCGTNLHERCPQCGAALRARQNFCRICGEPLVLEVRRPHIATPDHLAKRIAPVQSERKIATVLFADIANSTEIIKDLDPEESKHFLSPALEIMTNAVHRYEGIVVRDRGDGIMASFGAPVALEDHALRACYAALDVQKAIGERADQIAQQFGIPLAVRIGINSGPILVTVTEAERGREIRVDGLTTHIAARLEPLATPGSILISRDTLALSEGFVEVRELGTRHLKGIQDAVKVYQLEGVSTRMRIQALAARRMSKFVGRQAEIDILHRRAGQARSGRGQIVALMGEAGIGKSRIVLEFIHSDAMSEWQVLEAGSVSYGKATAYLPLVDLLTRYFEIHSRDNESRIRDKIVEKLTILGEEKLLAQTPFFLAALGMMVNNELWARLMPVERQRGMFDALKGLLILESQRKPLCLVFEDLHWVDEETHAFLDTLIDSVPAARLLMVVNYRPEHRSRWAGRSYFSEIRLEPLPAPSAAQMLEMLLGSHTDLDPLKQALIDMTEGNPLFLEESVRSLVESGMLAGTPDERRALGSLLSGFVPRTIEALLNSRVDRLQSRIKEVLQCAAVIGYEVPLALLQSVAGSDNDIEQDVRELQAAELLYEKTLFPDVVYTFKHAITREVVYASLTREKRKALHGTAAQSIGSRITPNSASSMNSRLNTSNARGQRPTRSTPTEKRPTISNGPSRSCSTCLKPARRSSMRSTCVSSCATPSSLSASSIVSAIASNRSSQYLLAWATRCAARVMPHFAATIISWRVSSAVPSSSESQASNLLRSAATALWKVSSSIGSDSAITSSATTAAPLRCWKKALTIRRNIRKGTASS